MSNYLTLISIPAYDINNNGLIIKIKLLFRPNEGFSITTKGAVALAISNNFHRIIEIMGSLKNSWKQLECMAYRLECLDEQFSTRDSKSSSMALSIALINAYRAINGRHQILGLTGTGILRIDGSFDKANLEDRKQMAAKNNMKSFEKFITAHDCDHLFQLEKFINQYQ